jgi:MFS family permease
MTSTTSFTRWWVVAGAFGVGFVGFGCVYTLATFLAPLQREFGASRAGVSAAFSFAGFVYFSLGALSGPMADRSGARPLVFAGMLLTAAGMAIAGLAAGLMQIYAAYGLCLGIGIGLAYVPALGAVQRWFARDRTLATGISVSGIGVGTMVAPPLARLLIDQVGWRHAYLWLAAASAVLGIASAIAMLGAPPKSGGAPVAADAPAIPASESLRSTLTSRRFIYLYLSCLICSFGLFVPFVHLVPYAVDHGIARNKAVLLMVAIGISSTAGRFVLGWILDRMKRPHAAAFVYVGMAGSFFLWAFSQSWPLLVAFAALFGMFYGGWVALLPALVADTFGAARASSMIGILYTSAALGTLLGPSAAGWIFDFSRSYMLPILLSAAGNLAAAILVLRGWSQGRSR